MEDARPSKRMHAAPGWSDLPSEIGGIILGRVPSFADRVCFSSVCRQWCLAARQHWRLLPPPPPALPWLVTSDPDVFVSLPDGARHRLPIHVEEPRVFDECLLSASRGDGDDVHRLLMNPLSKATMKLPSIRIFKLVMCSSDLVAAIVRSDGRSAVAFYRPDTRSWSVAHRPTEVEVAGLPLRDIALHRGKLYVLYGRDALCAYDLGDDGGAGEPKVSGPDVRYGA